MTARLGLILGLSAFAPGAWAAPTPPARVQITLTVIQVPDAVKVELGPKSAADVYKDLLMNSAGEATEISLVTPADFPGAARYNHAIVFTPAVAGRGGADGHNRVSRGILNETTFLEATPHVNSDGTITVRFKTQVTQNVPMGTLTPGLTETVTSQSAATIRTFQSGRTQVLGGLLTNPQSRRAGKQVLTFVTVSVLPESRE